MNKPDPGLISDDDREMLARLREIMIDAVNTIRHTGRDSAEKDVLANNLLLHVGYMNGMISRISDAYRGLKNNVNTVLQGPHGG